MAENYLKMPSHKAPLISLAIALALAGCARQSAPRAFGPANSQEAALRVAGAALAKIPDARKPYSVRQEGKNWLVATTPSPPPSNASYLVVIDAATGRAEVTAYQTATIDDEL